MSRRVLPFIFVPLLLACGESFVERPTTVVFDPEGKSFWSLPLPSAARIAEDGTVDYTSYPAPESAVTDAWLQTATKRSKGGYGVSNGVFFPLSGAVDESTLPQSAKDAMDKNASVYLVDIDEDSPERGRRFPLDVTFNAERKTSRPANTLSLIPTFGFVRRPSTLYAAVITDSVKDGAGQPLGRTKAFHEQWVDGGQFKALRDFLEKEKLDVTKVVGATVFRTMDPSKDLNALISWIEAQPQPQLSSPFAPAQDYADFRVFTATWQVPKVQTGDIPGHGAIAWAADGSPVQSGTQECRLVLTIPKRPMPAGGFPLMIYFHGSGGEAYEPVDRGAEPQDGPPPRPDSAPGTGPSMYLAQRGIASLGFDYPLHGTRRTPPDTTGLSFYSLFGKLTEPYNIAQTLDNMQVAVMETVYLTRLVGTFAIPASSATGLDAGGATDGMIRINPTRLSAMGHSMGSTLGIVIAGVDPRINGYVFSGAGGMLVEVGNSATYPVKLSGVVEEFMGLPKTEHISRDHPLLHIFQGVWDAIDPIAKARKVALEPDPVRGPRPYLMFAGVTDGYFHPLAQQAAAISLGGPVAGETVEETLPNAMALAERPAAAFPVSKNLNGVTAAVVQQTTPFELGHYIVFDTERAQSQYLCFVEKVGTADGPTIIAPALVSAPCP